MPRLAFKPDESFFRKLAIGAVGARAVARDLTERGHSIVELENGSTDTKIWKDVKRKRVRIPDLLCTKCGLRVESRAKTAPALTMSHSPTDAERTWDYGLVDTDVIAFPVCAPAAESDWSRGQLKDSASYWHKQDRVIWDAGGYINYFLAKAFRSVAAVHSATKGTTEGVETSISWDAIFSTRRGRVQAIGQGRTITVGSEQGRPYTWANAKDLPVVAEEGATVEPNQILACPLEPLRGPQLACTDTLTPDHIVNLLLSPERTQRFTGIKLARFRADAQVGDLVCRVTSHPDEDIYVKLEGATYLNRVCGQPAPALFNAHLHSADPQIRLEAIVALAQAATPDAAALLVDVLDREQEPFYLRSAAAWGLGQISTASCVERLVRAFSDVDAAIREEALEALGSIGAAALDPLLSGLADDDRAIAAGSAEAIRRLVELPSPAVQRIADQVAADSRRLWSVWLLGHLPREKDYVAAAIAQLQDSHPEAHYAIAVLWAFLESWIAPHWEIQPWPGSTPGEPSGS